MATQPQNAIDEIKKLAAELEAENKILKKKLEEINEWVCKYKNILEKVK